MNVAEYIAKNIHDNGVTDVFGIPGGVIIDLLYMFKKFGVTPHLSYHEQAAAFEACGYAQTNYFLGVAYATRGPGFTNLISGIADAYADSLPVLFITGHSGSAVTHEQRFEKEQELDTISMVKYITKYATTIDEIDEVELKVQKALKEASTGRKGPVLLDVSSSLWNKEIIGSQNGESKQSKSEKIDLQRIEHLTHESQRPVFLMGEGIRQSETYDGFIELIGRTCIPILSSRGSQDCAHGLDNYFGYIGSHGIRYANTIFELSDLVISLGNRLAFPVNSESFSKAITNKKIVRFEIDEDELKRKIPNTVNIKCNLIDIVNNLTFIVKDIEAKEWLNTCKSIKQRLRDCDTNSINIFIKDYLQNGNYKYVIADVGNNEFWTSQAYEMSNSTSRVLYSRSFGTLGCGLCKAIGCYYRTKEKILLIVGDQGIQLNIQELQLIAKEHLPIHILIINNTTSGMIKDQEKIKEYYIHTTLDTGYGNPDFEYVAKAYGLGYKKIADGKEVIEINRKEPMIIEYMADSNIELEPKLLKGHAMSDMYPT